MYYAEHHRDAVAVGDHRDVRLFRILLAAVVAPFRPTVHVRIRRRRRQVQWIESAGRTFDPPREEIVHAGQRCSDVLGEVAHGRRGRLLIFSFSPIMEPSIT